MHEVWPGGEQDDVPRGHDQHDPEPAPEYASYRAADGEAVAVDPADTSPQEGHAAEGPRLLDVGVRPTGHGEIDASLRRLADADHLAVSGHLEVYEDVHRGLRSTLTALDQHDPGS